jgi:antitoxin ParD1/3/4
VETTAVASLLWDEILAPGTHAVIANALGLPLDEARRWSLFLTGIHDLGKASPSFQSKSNFAVARLLELGYRFPANGAKVPGKLTWSSRQSMLHNKGWRLPMDVHLTAELEQLVQSRVETGRYNSPGEVVREALRLLEERDAIITLRKEEIREEIAQGVDSLRLGKGVDGEAVFDRIEGELDTIERIGTS